MTIAGQSVFAAETPTDTERTADGSDELHGQRIVVGTDGTVVETVTQDAAEMVRVIDFGDGERAVVGWFPEEKAESLQAMDGVRYVERDRKIQVPQPVEQPRNEPRTEEPADLSETQTVPFGVELIGARAVATAGISGEGIDVAVLDTGIDPSHPDLKPNVGNGRAFLFGRDPGDWADDNGHGTSVAGIIAAADNGIGVVGVSPDATLHAGKVLNSQGFGFFSDLAAGLRWAGTNGFDVVNMSLSGPSRSRILSEAVRFAVNRGVNLVGSAGNEGPCTDCVNFPAAFGEVIAVSATTRQNTFARFSSSGPQIDLTAPGVALLTTQLSGGYRRFSGTSASAPHVSGALALLAAADYVTTARQDRLEESATDIRLPGVEGGHGLVDAADAVLGVDLQITDETEAGDGFVSNFDVVVRADTRLENTDRFSAGEPYFEIRIDGKPIRFTGIVDRDPQFRTQLRIPADRLAGFRRGEVAVTALLWDADVLFDDLIDQETESIKLDPAETASIPSQSQSGANSTDTGRDSRPTVTSEPPDDRVNESRPTRQSH